ncbi:MAG: M14 family metallocarboxypeptidase [Nibricoccus sp.]
MPPTPIFDPPELVANFETEAQKNRFQVERFGEIAGCPLIALTKRTPGPRPRIYLSAGIHGDEPAPPLALLRLLEQGFFDVRAVWFICPLLNPAGFLRRTRENASGLDLNRDYKMAKSAEIIAHIRWFESQPNFDLGLCLHEDWEATGTYLYELNPKMRPSMAEAIIAAIAKKHPIDLAPMIDGREASGGIIRPNIDPVLREQWPEAIYLRAHHTSLGYTIETPSAFPLEQRIDVQCTAVTAAVNLCVDAYRRAVQTLRDPL